MSKSLSICALCFLAFEASTSYGLCQHCISKDALREFDRLETALSAARRAKLPAKLTLPEWLAILSDFSGSCAFCLVRPFERLETMHHVQGVIQGNVVPVCRSCSQHRKEGWATAVERVQRYLSGEEGDLVAKRYPVFLDEEMEEERVEA
jgi:hypothetical protein